MLATFSGTVGGQLTQVLLYITVGTLLCGSYSYVRDVHVLRDINI
jgi:hypothetical protein